MKTALSILEYYTWALIGFFLTEKYSISIANVYIPKEKKILTCLLLFNNLLTCLLNLNRGCYSQCGWLITKKEKGEFTKEKKKKYLLLWLEQIN